MKHTPGPWRIEIDDSPDAEWSHRYPNIIADEYEVVGFEGMYGDLETDMANARLIAAAPDMIEALKLIVRYGDCFAYKLGEDNPYEKACAAIRKATGND